jgi:hypothetical protein
LDFTSCKDAYWLPASDGPFVLTMPLYAAREASLTGDWALPPITQVSSQAADDTAPYWNMAEWERLANVVSALRTAGPRSTSGSGQ